MKTICSEPVKHRISLSTVSPEVMDHFHFFRVDMHPKIEEPENLYLMKLFRFAQIFSVSVDYGITLRRYIRIRSFKLH